MFIDAAAIIAILSEEQEAERCSTAVMQAVSPMTSPLAAWEAAVALARADKFDAPLDKVERLVLRFLEDRGISLCDLPDADTALALSLEAARRFRTGAQRLNLADCFHYACARAFSVPILSTTDEFRFTDLETVP